MELVRPREAMGKRSRSAVAGAMLVALAGACVVVALHRGTAGGGARSLAERAGAEGEPASSTDEVMKPWADGMYPPNAHFPPGYSFGSNNVFGVRDTFGAGDRFGENNVFGKHSSFGSGSVLGDKNSIGAFAKFGAGVTLGDSEAVGRGSEFGPGDIIGGSNLFGRGVKFAPRVSMGQKNIYGFDSEFGRRDEVGAYAQVGSGALFGSRVQFGKGIQFGSDVTFHPEEELQGDDQFGTHDYGLTPSKLPESDRAAWNATADPKFVPPRGSLYKVMSLDSLNTERTVLGEVKKANEEAEDVRAKLKLLSEEFTNIKH